MANDDKILHIRLNSSERQVLVAMKAKFGASTVGAVRACIRAAAERLEIPIPSTQSEE